MPVLHVADDAGPGRGVLEALLERGVGALEGPERERRSTRTVDPAV